LDARACHLSRSGAVDWSALLNLMAVAAQHGKNPFGEAVHVQERLFTVKPIFLGVEESLKHPLVPCNLHTDAERARHVKRLVREMLNSRGEWEPVPAPTERLLREIYVRQMSRLSAPSPDETTNIEPGKMLVLRSILTEPIALEKVGHGSLVVLKEENGLKTYGRAVTVAERLHDDRVLIAKWIRRMTNWNGRQAPFAVWQEQ